MVTFTELSERQRRVLGFLLAAFGSHAKRRLRRAWESGDYSGVSLRAGSEDEAEMQSLRNTHGLYWLCSAPLSRLIDPPEVAPGSSVAVAGHFQEA